MNPPEPPGGGDDLLNQDGFGGGGGPVVFVEGLLEFEEFSFFFVLHDGVLGGEAVTQGMEARWSFQRRVAPCRRLPW